MQPGIVGFEMGCEPTVQAITQIAFIPAGIVSLDFVHDVTNFVQKCLMRGPVILIPVVFHLAHLPFFECEMRRDASEYLAKYVGDRVM